MRRRGRGCRVSSISEMFEVKESVGKRSGLVSHGAHGVTPYIHAHIRTTYVERTPRTMTDGMRTRVHAEPCLLSHACTRVCAPHEGTNEINRAQRRRGPFNHARGPLDQRQTPCATCSSACGSPSSSTPFVDAYAYARRRLGTARHACRMHTPHSRALPTDDGTVRLHDAQQQGAG